MIGITGRAGAGKSYLARELAEMHGHVRHVSFASQLRKEIEAVLGVRRITNLWVKPTSPEVRFILQQYGTEYRRAQDPDYWVKRGMAEAKTYTDDGWGVVFDDVRFPNEADAIGLEGGLIVRVHTPSNVRTARLGTAVPDHASEAAMDGYLADISIIGTSVTEHDKVLREIMVEATIEDIDFMEGIRESFCSCK